VGAGTVEIEEQGRRGRREKKREGKVSAGSFCKGKGRNEAETFLLRGFSLCSIGLLPLLFCCFFLLNLLDSLDLYCIFSHGFHGEEINK